jgi:preprotein translocase subunit SecY
VKNGLDTEKHITRVLNRINWLGAPFLAVVAVLPYVVSLITGIPSGLALGGTGIIIIVTATVELWNSIKSASTTSGYNVTRTRIESRFYQEPADEEDPRISQLW